MYLYYFDVVRDGELISDKVGMSLPDIAAARREATLTLSDLTKNAVRASGGFRRMSVLVRNAQGPMFEEYVEWDSSPVH